MAANEQAEPVPFDGEKSRFVGQVITEISRRVGDGMGAGAGGLFKNRGDRSTFVAAYAKLNASFKFKQIEAVDLSEWLEEATSAFFDDFGAGRGNATPVHDDGVWLYFD